jgi:mannose-1-phosphate guanylyltransferase
VKNNRPWAIVLAAGEGQRLRKLTTDRCGRSTPKQFCSLDGGPSLLEHALERARSVADAERIVTIVAAEQREHWEATLECLPAENVIVQPANRGTAAGVLLPLLAVLKRDPDAHIAILPSDQYADDERTLRGALVRALDFVYDDAEIVTLLGITPDADVSDYGWILPAPGDGPLRRIWRFVEKPERPLATELLQRGALWNSFLLAAQGRALLALYKRRLPALLERLHAADPKDGFSLRRLYDGLETSDFSRDLLQGSESRLRLVSTPPCGWTDLGTPQRVAECLRARTPAALIGRGARSRTLVLAEALVELEARASAAPDEERTSAGSAPGALQQDEGWRT